MMMSTPNSVLKIIFSKCDNETSENIDFFLLLLGAKNIIRLAFCVLYYSFFFCQCNIRIYKKIANVRKKPEFLFFFSHP